MKLTIKQVQPKLKKDSAAVKDAMKSLSKSEFGTAWAVFRNPANGAYLLAQRAPGTNNEGQWGFPGGGVDEGESHVQALRREVNEECGILLALSVFKPIMSQDDLSVEWYEVFQKVTPKKTKEISAYKWVMAYDMDELELHKSVRHYFKALHNHTKRGE